MNCLSLSDLIAKAEQSVLCVKLIPLMTFKLKTLLFRGCKKNQLVRNMWAYGITNYAGLYEPLCRSYLLFKTPFVAMGR